MCFSATASFGSAALLTLASALTAHQAREKKMRIFALIPALFAVQQLAEGMLWTVATNPDHVWYWLSTYIFLCGVALWPAFIPLVFYWAEPSDHKRGLSLVACLGIIFFLGGLSSLLLYGATALVGEQHIAYQFWLPALPYSAIITQAVYLVCVVIPPFLSTLPRAWIFGVGVIGTFIGAHVWYAAHFTSIWCFFTALLSALALVIVR